MGAAWQTTAAQDPGAARDRRLSPLAAGRDRSTAAGPDRVSRGDRRQGDLRPCLPGHEVARTSAGDAARRTGACDVAPVRGAARPAPRARERSYGELVADLRRAHQGLDEKLQ